METYRPTSPTNSRENLFETLRQDSSDIKLPKPTPLDFIVNNLEFGKDSSFPNTLTFDNFSDSSSALKFISGKKKFVSRPESRDLYSPSFSTVCDDNLNNVDFSSDGFSTSKSEANINNILFKSPRQRYSPYQESLSEVASLPDFSPVHTGSSFRVNSPGVFSDKEIREAPLLENNLYCPETPVIYQNEVMEPGQLVEVEGEHSFIDYSQINSNGKTTDCQLVQDGFDYMTNDLIKYVNVKEKTVEVPVVHKLDTIINVDKIQEVEKLIKIPYEHYVDKVVEESETFYNDRIVEVPEYHEVTKTVKVPQVKERIKYQPKFDVRTVPKYVEVPNLQIVDKFEEYEEVEEVVKYVPQTRVIDVPKQVIKTVVTPVKKIIEQEVIKPVIKTRRVPVEKIKYVDKYETVEVIRNIPQIIDIPVPQPVPKVEYVDQPYEVEKYRDIPVPYPAKKTITPIYYYTDKVKYVEIPVYKPYLVVHDQVRFRSCEQLLNDDFSGANHEPAVTQDGAPMSHSRIVSIKPLHQDSHDAQ